MFGDDLKKSLEPIQTSDALLEKTRKAIEAARVEEARKSLEQSSKKSFSSGKYIRLGALIASVVVVGIGIMAVYPMLGAGKKSDSSSHAHGEMKITEVAEAVDIDAYDSAETTSYKNIHGKIDISNNLGDDKDSSKSNLIREGTTAASTTKMEEEVAQTTVVCEAEETTYAEESEETTAPAAETTNNSVNSLLFSKNTMIYGQTLSIDSDNHKLCWSNNIDAIGSDAKNYDLPELPPLNKLDRIEGIAFLEEKESLGVVVNSPVTGNSKNGFCSIYLYKLNDTKWEETYSFSQSGTMGMALFTDANTFMMYSNYKDDPDAEQITPLIRVNNGNWETLPDDQFTKLYNGRGGSYLITTYIDLNTMETDCSAMYNS